MSRLAPFVVVLLPLVALAGEPAKKPVVKTAAAPAAGGMNTGAGEMSCGQMMEKKSALPQKMSEVMTAVSDDLNAHAEWVGTKDKNAKAENEALMKLAKQHKEMAEKFKEISASMMKMKDLPNAPHDMKSPQMAKVMESEQKLMRLEREMAQMLTQDASDMEQHMSKMKQGSGGN